MHLSNVKVPIICTALLLALTCVSCMGLILIVHSQTDLVPDRSLFARELTQSHGSVRSRPQRPSDLQGAEFAVRVVRQWRVEVEESIFVGLRQRKRRVCITDVLPGHVGRLPNQTSVRSRQRILPRGSAQVLLATHLWSRRSRWGSRPSATRASL